MLWNSTWKDFLQSHHILILQLQISFPVAQECVCLKPVQEMYIPSFSRCLETHQSLLFLLSWHWSTQGFFLFIGFTFVSIGEKAKQTIGSLKVRSCCIVQAFFFSFSTWSHGQAMEAQRWKAKETKWEEVV